MTTGQAESDANLGKWRIGISVQHSFKNGKKGHSVRFDTEYPERPIIELEGNKMSEVIDKGNGIKTAVSELPPVSVETQWRQAYLSELKTISSRLGWILFIMIGVVIIQILAALLSFGR
jgi:hypothetical protein